MSDASEYERVLVRRMREDTHEARPRPSRTRTLAALPAVLVRDRRRKSRTRPEAQAGSQSRRSVASLDDALTRARRSRSARGLSRLQRGLVGPRRRDVHGRARWPAIRDVREPRARDSGAPAPTIPPTSTRALAGVAAGAFPRHRTAAAETGRCALAPAARARRPPWPSRGWRVCGVHHLACSCHRAPWLSAHT